MGVSWGGWMKKALRPSAHPASPVQLRHLHIPEWHGTAETERERARLSNRKWQAALRTARSYLWRRMCGGDDKLSASSAGVKPPTTSKSRQSGFPGPAPRSHSLPPNPAPSPRPLGRRMLLNMPPLSELGWCPKSTAHMSSSREVEAKEGEVGGAD